MPKKTVAVITGTRAEYGLLRPVLQKMQKSKILSPRLVVTGAHLSAAFGNTVGEIEADGIAIAARIEILKFGCGRLATARTVAYAIDKFSEYFTAHRPDAVLVLGDRYEIFAAGTAAALLEIPLAHISGGDVTYGAADEYFRHCLTKMASIHFPSCETYARRLIAMGENPATVHNVGGLGDENLRNLPLMDRDALAKSIGFDLSAPFALVTYHPETAGGASPVMQFQALLSALEKTSLRCIFTKANADAGGTEINAAIDAACAAQPQRFIAFTSMGVVRYLSAMRFAALVIGNSSSGVVETPTLGVPTVNIGDRQKGRIVCDNVLCCGAGEAEISTAIAAALTPAFATKAKATVSPYTGTNTSGKIVALLEDFVIQPCTPKAFYDITKEDLA